MTEGHHSDLPAFVPTARPIPAARAFGDGTDDFQFGVATQFTQVASALMLDESTRRAAWIDVARLIVFVFLLDLLAGVLLYLFIEETDDRKLLLPTVVLRTAFSIGIIALILRARGQRSSSVGLHREHLAVNVLIGMLAPVVVFGIVLLVMSLLWLVWPPLWSEMQKNAGQIMTLVPNLHPLGFAILTAMVGFYEELVFRGFLLTRLRRATGNWAIAALISTAIFVPLHFSQVSVALVPVTILSLMFCILTIWRRSLVPAIVAHSLWNFCQFLYLSIQAGDSWT